MLKFSEANAKTKSLYGIKALRKYLRNNRKVYSLDMLSGWTCPAARDCFAKVFVENGKRRLQDGPFTQFRCFSASQEVAYPNVFNARQHNFSIIKNLRHPNHIAEVICTCLPKNAGIIRLHVAGDFFKLTYLKGVILAASYRQDVLFYAYTKMLNLLAQVNMDDPSNGVLHENFLITASVGGKYDSMIENLGIRTAKVVFSKKEAKLQGLAIDHDDSHAATKGGNFALLLHGIQPKGSEAAVALKELKGQGAYRR